MAAATDRWVRRHNRRTRWFHAGVYLTTLTLLGTGWWLLAGREGRPSPLAWLTGIPDTTLHTAVGWAFVALAVAGPAWGFRGARTFVRESVRFTRTDLWWFARWPAATLTGRFAHHDGHFDPGQRLINLMLAGGLLVLAGTGAGMASLHGGPVFALLAQVHVWTTQLITWLIAGHIAVASGVLPGYRGVWRSMHLGGRLDRSVAFRLWPGWAARQKS
ncbi:cytochrome b/b6 domain-containing protein [Nonomuraea sp. K274]|uniref:Cytochrome b/b6 domain-containing protein n=1 Tax=Nonomuraea cypriaca TaxID=1187855 RepID=A0A931A3F9_9ACTN|nr:cytochrome b/b6 domain-containing protein [Nonomuraea cypriaca]MBF8184378.1 cytochrome b/b6 domain-containing protein [Nonomuraea cypriaca]